MKNVFGFCSLLTILCLIPFLTGCSSDAHVTHDVSTGGNGSLEGLVFTPEPQSLKIGQNENFFLDWNSDFTPPAQFTVSLKKIALDGTTTGIYTELKESSVGHYSLDPTSALPAQTFVLLTVSGDGLTDKAIYLTGGTPPATTKSEPVSGEGKLEHTVTTR